MTTYKGYHDPKTLPQLQGKKVRLPAGTEVKSLKRGTYTLKRAQTVTVHHLGCGMSVCVGSVSSNGQRVGRFLSRGDATLLKDIFGTDDLDVLVNHPDTVVRNFRVFLPVRNPTVCWPGTGGYWCEADINVATLV